MRINKIRVQNYKSLKDVCIPVNQDLNVFVGENDAGKSTLLEVISIIASGKLNGYAFNKQIKDNMFNMHVRNAYIASLSGTPIEPPVIVMEAYCSDKTAPYAGTNNSLGEDCGGIRVLVELDPQHSDRYTELLRNGKIKDVPVEFYHVDFHYFNGDPVSYRTSPLKAVVVDTTRKDYTGMVDRFVSENITEYLSDQEQVELSAAYRRVRSDFRTSDTVARLNKKVSESDRLKGRNISIELRESDLDEWKRQMAISVDTIPFEQIGFGTQNTIKVELAIENGADDANILLFEEPENCLSHTNMTKLIHRVSTTAGRQVFISTHSSFVANKLCLNNLLLVKNGTVTPFKDLNPETISYFLKLPGYDTLRLVLAERVILVEGPTDDLLIQRAFKDRFGCLPIEKGTDVISVGSLAFKRFCDIAMLMNKSVYILTDNDGDIQKNINTKYADYIKSSLIKIFYDSNEKYKTIEPSVLAANCDENGQPTEQFKRIISSNGSLLKRDHDSILSFMSGNKAEWAMRVFDSDEAIKYPKHIEALLDECC